VRRHLDLPCHYLMRVMQVDVLAIGRSVGGSISAYRWIETDQQGSGNAYGRLLTKSFPKRPDLQKFDVQKAVTAKKAVFLTFEGRL